VLVGTLERDRIEIASEADEPIVAIEVREGDHVTAGQVLLSQQTELSAARLAEADARVAQAEHFLAELVKGPRVEVINEARARLAAAQAAVERDDKELERVSALVESRLLPDAQLDQVRAAHDASVAAAREAREQLTALLRGNREEEIERARAALEAARAAREQLALTQARLLVRASRDGVVEALPFEIGERPPRGTPVAVLLADGAAYARVYVPEPQRAHVRPGLRAQIAVDGIDEPLPGFVRWVASEAAFTPYYALTQRDRSRLAFLAEVEVTDARRRELPAGIPVEVTILGDGGD